MVKMLYRPLLVMLLLLPFVLGLSVTAAQEDVPLLYVTDYNHMDDFYIGLDVTTGDTERFERPSGFVGIPIFGEGRNAEREDITSPYDDAVRFVLLRDFDAQKPEDEEHLYRVRAEDQLEPVLAGEHIYMWPEEFTDNGRYVYLYRKSGSDIQNVFYTVYRYDIQSAELQPMVGRVPYARLNCQEEGWCEVISGAPGDEDTSQSLFVLHKNSGELRKVATAGDITIHRWWEPNVLLYTVYDGDGQATFHTYSVETSEDRILAAIEGQGIVTLYRWGGQADSPETAQTADWLMVVAISPENNHIFDLYIVNDPVNSPTTYALGIQTSSGTWFNVALSDGSLVLVTRASQNNKTNDVYLINDAATHPTVDRVTPADFDAMTLHDVRLESDLGDTQLMRVGVSNEEWRYYTLHVPTRTITPLATFSSNQWAAQRLLSADNRWLAVSIEDAGSTYYVGVVPTDGSQPLQMWDVGTESYVCLLAWDAPGSEPPACSLYFGIG